MHRLSLRVQRGQEIDVDTVRILIDAGFGPFVFDRLEYDTEIRRITGRRA